MGDLAEVAETDVDEAVIEEVDITPADKRKPLGTRLNDAIRAEIDKLIDRAGGVMPREAGAYLAMKFGQYPQPHKVVSLDKDATGRSIEKTRRLKPKEKEALRATRRENTRTGVDLFMRHMESYGTAATNAHGQTIGFGDRIIVKDGHYKLQW